MHLNLWHWSIPRLTRFLKYRPRVLPTHRNATRKEFQTVRRTLADLMTELLFDSVANTLAEM